MKIIPDFDCVRGVRGPFVHDDKNILVRIFFQQVFKALDDDEAVFPVVKPAVDIASVDVYGGRHLEQSFRFLFGRPFWFFFFCPDAAVVLFDRNFCFLVKAENNAVGRGIVFQVVYFKFFFAKSGSLLYNQGIFFLYLMLSALMILRVCEGLIRMPCLFA